MHLIPLTSKNLHLCKVVSLLTWPLSMARLQVWRHAPGKAVLFFTDVMSATALIFEGKFFCK